MSARETVSPKIGENIEMLVCLICMGTQDRTLIDINHHNQITMINIKIEYKCMQSNIFIVSTAYLFKLLWYIFLDKEILKKASIHGWLMTIFYFTWPADRKQTTF